MGKPGGKTGFDTGVKRVYICLQIAAPFGKEADYKTETKPLDAWDLLVKGFGFHFFLRLSRAS